MLTTSKKTQFGYLRRILVLPLIAAVICLFAFTIKKQTIITSQTIIAAKTFKLVVDAGHGGKDDGTVSNGLYEKSVALKIAEKIKDLSSKYNINVVLTRDKDVYMSPPEKADFANSQNADAFISVHVNAAYKNDLSKAGMEVVLSKRNTNVLDNSQALGSAIIQNLQTNFKIVPALLQQQVGIWVLDQNKVPSVLIECGYMTNADDVKLLKDNEKIQLMAQNILEGVTMYANNRIDKNKLYKIKDRNSDTSVPAQSNSMLQKQPEPLYVMDGRIVSRSEAEQGSLEPGNILSVNTWKGKAAIDKYGDRGKNGVVEITSKPATSFKPPTIVKDSNFTDAGFPGGIDGWRKYLESNLNANVPAKKHAPAGTYTVTVSFKVDEEGKVSEVKSLTDPGYGTAQEAIRVIAKGPNWIPAKINDKRVETIEKQNISFQVTN